MNKSLAQNVPVNFSQHLEHAKNQITRETRWVRGEDFKLVRYRRCLDLLEIEEAADRLFEIEVRFRVIRMTIDQSIPVSPILKRYRGLAQTLSRMPRRDQVLDDAMNAYTAEVLGYEDPTDIPHEIDDFRNARTLAEKALIADMMVKGFAKQMGEIAEHFDYKKKMFGKGAGRSYGLSYLVFALWQVFHRYSDGTKAFLDPNHGYRGDFLELVTLFVFVADPGLIGNQFSDGFSERVRQIHLKREADIGLVALLDREEVGPEVVLEFMSRINALK